MNIRYSNDEKVFNINCDGIPYLSFDVFDGMGIPNLFSTRYISYDEASGTGVKGLRTAVMKTDDLAEASPVCRGYRDVMARQLGSSLAMELVTDQKHTNYVYVATQKEDLGIATVGKFARHRQYVDGIVTNIPDAVITVFGGDCPPVYLADPVRDAAGLVHAGWKGTLGRIPQVAIEQMTFNFGTYPDDIYAAIGPGICVDCYEMGDEVYEQFAAEWSREEADMIFRRYPAVDAEGREIPGGKYHLDLRLANKLTLLRAGVPEDHIVISNVCTMCNVDTFYSYRARRMENEQVAMLVNHYE